MARLLLWTGLASAADSPDRPPADLQEREDLSDARRRQANGEIAADLEPGLLQLAVMGMAVAPIAMPHVVRRITGLEVNDPEFQASYTELVRGVLRHLATPSPAVPSPTSAP